MGDTRAGRRRCGDGVGDEADIAEVAPVVLQIPRVEHDHVPGERVDETPEQADERPMERRNVNFHMKPGVFMNDDRRHMRLMHMAMRIAAP